MKFKVGDEVRSITNKHAFTNEIYNWEGKIIEVADTYFKVKTTYCVIEDIIGKVFKAYNEEDFELIKSWPIIKDHVLRVDALISDLIKRHKDAFDNVNFEYSIKAKKLILDESEKRYLSGIIKPFRNKVKSIYKFNGFDGEWIAINLNSDVINLPTFEANTMYKGMKLNKEYTLEELGL